MRYLITTLFVIAVAGGLSADTPKTHSGNDAAFFEKKIRPALVKYCFECHSSDSEDIGGKLRLDSGEAIAAGGESGPAVQPNKPDASLIVQAVRYHDVEMPPDTPLPQNIVNDFVRWVEQGAYYPPQDTAASKRISAPLDPESHWSFIERKIPAVPDVENTTWPQSAIDYFVLAKLESQGLQPTDDANPETILRRIYIDLTGLPPSFAQLQAFSEDHLARGQEAYANVVDRLLGSSQFGERWGRHWLDVARYGESNGDDGLGRNASFPHAWRYRDYVIDSFNRDVPYDRLVTEQIAGDLLPAKTITQRNRQLTATGFLAIGSKPAAAMNKNFAMDVVDDQIDTVSTAVMGLSVACARCHDHKHDPVPTRDYYAMAGIFNSTETLYGLAANEKLTAPPTPLHALKTTLGPATPSTINRERLEFPSRYRSTVASLLPSLHARLDQRPSQSFQAKTAPSYSTEQFASVKSSQIRGAIDGTATDYSVSFWFKNDTKNRARPITAYLFSRGKIGDKKLPGDHIGIGGKHDVSRAGKLFVFNGNDKKQSIAGSTVIPPGSWNHVALSRKADRIFVVLNGQRTPEIDGSLPNTFGTSREFCFGSRSDQFAPLVGNLADIAIFDRPLSLDEIHQLHDTSGQPRGPDPERVEYAMGVREKAKLANCKIHINGDGAKKGPEVARGVLSAYREFQDGSSASGFDAQVKIDSAQSGRLQLAQWLTHPHHPHTARVMVNRIWQHLFGRGIVATPDDFGVYGARPTHPLLLDYLANQFVHDGWSIKRFIRSVVLSRTYRLDSTCGQELLETDPDNRLLARHQCRRLDAESLRDSILLVTGTLDRMPRRGSDVDHAVTLINWPPGHSTNLHRPSNRRSIYLCMLRHAPPSDLIAFDLPSGVSVTGKRETTTLPTQALFLLNSSFVAQCAEKLADFVLSSESSDLRRVETVFERTLGRRPTDWELNRSLRHIEEVSHSIASDISAPKTRLKKSWGSLCQALLSSNEFRYVD